MAGKKEKKICAYCGDASVNHRLYKLGNMFSSVVDSHMINTTNYAPQFLKDFAGFIPVILFKTLAKLGLSKFSDDIEKVSSFRSRVIWEEAKRRGIKMEQVIIGKKPIEWYRAELNGKTIYFESIPIQAEFLDFKKDWDDKIVLKRELKKKNIPVPEHEEISIFSTKKLESIFSKFTGKVIVKPKIGSRARHTITDIKNIDDFKKAVSIAREISTHLVVEDHLDGYVCRATIVGGKLCGFYMGKVPFVTGDGKSSINSLIEEKNKNNNPRYSIKINDELINYLSRSGFTLEDTLPEGVVLNLSHRRGQLSGGYTEEFIEKLHPSFVKVLEDAGEVVGLSVIGFDCIIPDPSKDEKDQKWGIIECNTLPFIDMHYYALEGKPRNIAGMIWDLWGA